MSGCFRATATSDLGCRTWPLSQGPSGPHGPHSRGHSPLGQPAPSPAKSRSLPHPALRGRPIAQPRTLLRQLGISPSPASRRRHRVGAGRSLNKHSRGPMAYFRLRVQANEVCGAGLPSCRRAVFPAAAPGCGVGEETQAWNQVRTYPAETRPASLSVLWGQLPGKNPRGLGAAGRRAWAGEHTPSPDLALRCLCCSSPGWAQRKISFS